jgi:hypothetical protein
MPSQRKSEHDPVEPERKDHPTARTAKDAAADQPTPEPGSPEEKGYVGQDASDIDET